MTDKDRLVNGSLILKPLEKADIELVEIKDGVPCCKIHGAMNKVSADGFYRCTTLPSGKCRAGCIASPRAKLPDWLIRDLHNILTEEVMDHLSD